MDFMFDKLIIGIKFKILTVVDDYSKVCPDLKVGGSITGSHVTRFLNQISDFYGYPKRVRVDNGTEFRCKEFVLWAFKKVGSSTKFTINLPVIKKELTNEEIIEIQEKITHFEKYILLVEDEMAISDVQYKVLTQDSCNHIVDVANNGRIAMDLFNRNQYYLISLDYILLGGINGLEVYNYIRKENKTVPILFVSGNIEFLESIKELKQKIFI
jgi:CheY-like chemotaxis protein